MERVYERCWIKKVKKGTGTGGKMGYPTLNFNVGDFGKHYSEGVYKCEVRIKEKTYTGALFFGTRMNCKKALEIHVIGLNSNIYGRFVSFRVLKKIRKTKEMKSLAELKKQIEKDINLIL